MAINAEVKKLLKSSFIYPVPLTEWVSNIVHVTKKQGTIHVFINYRDINKACPKDNYPTTFIDQIIDNCGGSIILSLIDNFSEYNQIDILLVDQHKTTFIFPWGTFPYWKLPFGLKNVGGHTHSTISNILLNPTSMNYPLTHFIDDTTFFTSDPYFFDFGLTTYV